MTAIGILLIIFAIFIIPILIILAFIAPKLLNIKTDKRPEGKHNRKEFLTGLCGLFIISVIAGGLMMPSADKAETAKDTPAPVAPKPTSADPAPISTSTPQAVASLTSAPQATEQVKTLGITPEEFNKKFANIIKTYGVRSDILPPIKPDNTGEFIMPFSQGITILGNVDKKSGKITTISYGMTSMKGGAKYVAVFNTLGDLTSEILVPNKPKTLVTTMLQEAMKEYSESGKEEYEKSMIIDSVLYKITIQQGVGIMMSFQPA